MDLISTLTLFATILGIGALVGAALGFLFSHDHSDPRRRLKRSLVTGGTTLVVLIIFLLQYMQAPASSVLTLIPRFPFPGSTLNACSVSLSDLPHGTTPATIAPSPDPTIAGTSLTIRGGSALSGPMTTAAAVFDRVNHTMTQVHASNSSQGIEDVEAGDADLGLSGNFKEDDPAATTSHYFADLADHMLAVVPFALVVSPDIHATVHNLTSQQLIDIYNGIITNWRQIGGPDEAITVVNRTTGSATRINFELFVTRSQSKQGIGVDEQTTGQVLNLVANSSGSIGYAATANILGQRATGEVRAYPVCLNGTAPTKAAIADGQYPFWSFEHVYTKRALSPEKRAAVDDFLRYVCSDAFKQDLLIGDGFLRIADLQPKVSVARQSTVQQAVLECAPRDIPTPESPSSPHDLQHLSK
jgi:phosphate transport system substrate-binding protein